MSEILLSILIPVTPDRQKMADKLEFEFWRQMKDLLPHIEIIQELDNKEMTIGEKRNIMYQKANGIYSVQWDSDDWISDDGIKKIFNSIMKCDYDCCTYEEYVNIDGNEYKSNHSLEYADWDGDGNKIFSDGFHFHRTPFFKSVIKTEIAKSVPVPHERFGEDHHWAQALKSNLKSEVHIPEQIYHYLHISSDFNERYGIKQ